MVLEQLPIPTKQNESHINELIEILSSKETKRHYRRFYRNIFNFLIPKFEDKFFLDYTYQELKQLIIWIDNQKWSKTEKQKHIAALKKLRLTCEEPYLSKGKRYNDLDYSFVFDYKNILKRDFKDTPSRKTKKTYFSINEWKVLIKKVKDINPFHYIIFRLMESSCRIGGLVKIKVNKINLDIGFFSSTEKNVDVRYFFDKNFIQDLKWFIMRKDLSNADWLFPSPIDQHNHISTEAIRKNIIHKYTKINPHDIRRSMLRIFEQNGALQSDLFLISNHKPNMNAVYTMVDAWNEEKKAQERYQLVYDRAFYQ